MGGTPALAANCDQIGTLEILSWYLAFCLRPYRKSSALWMGCQMKGKGPGTFDVLDSTESQFSYL